MQKLKRWVAGVLAALLLVAVPARSLAVVAYAADPVSVSVAVGAGAGGGLGLAAANLVGATVAACVLAACGVKAYVSAADAAGMTKTEYLGSLMQQWSQAEYDNAQQLQEDIAYSTYVTSDGALHLKSAAAQKIKAFGDWLVQGGNAESVPVYDAVPSGLTWGSFPLHFYTSSTFVLGSSVMERISPNVILPSGVTINYLEQLTGFPFSCAFFECTFNGDSGLMVLIDNLSTRSTPLYVDLTPPSASSPLRNGVSRANYHSKDDYYYAFFPYSQKFYFSLSGYNPPVFSPSADLINPASGVIGNPTDWAANEDVINLGGTDVGDVTISPDLINQLDLSGVATDVVISLQSYIDSLVDAINGLKDKVVSLQDALTLEDIATIPVPDTIDTSIYVPTNPAITIPDDAIGVIDGEIPAPPPPVPPGDKIIADYSYDLTSVFPFCIPFDIVRALSLLNAEPEAPKASFTWDIPLVGLNYTMEFDLAPWSGVAQVLRTMELLVFTIGLGLVTRKLIMA